MRRRTATAVVVGVTAAVAAGSLLTGKVFALFASTSSSDGNTFSASTCFQPVQVNIANFSFSPTPLTIARGCSITWINTVTTKHSALSDTGVWDSGQLSQNQTFTRRFDTAGTFTYKCANHSGTMQATVVVN